MKDNIQSAIDWIKERNQEIKAETRASEEPGYSRERLYVDVLKLIAKVPYDDGFICWDERIRAVAQEALKMERDA